LCAAAWNDGLDAMLGDGAADQRSSVTEPSTGTMLNRLPGELAVDLVERELVGLEQDQRLRRHLATMRQSSEPIEPPAAGDHDHPALDHRSEQLGIGRHRRAAEQVVDVDLAQLADDIFARGDLADRGQGADLDRQLAEFGDDLLPPRVTRPRGSERMTSLTPRSLVSASSRSGG
jgi:hypothetical protein